MKKYLVLFLLFMPFLFFGLTIDNKTITNWSDPGADFIVPESIKKISILDFGGKADNSTDNSVALQTAIKSLNGSFGVIEIPAGNYLFRKSITVPSNVLIKGKGSDKTILNFNLNGRGDLFSFQGNSKNSSVPILSGTVKDSRSIKVNNASNFTVNDYVLIKQTTYSLLASNWAYHYFFQIVKITKIIGNEIYFSSPLRMDFPAFNNPVILKINPIQNSGIESLKIKRTDVTSEQTSNIFFNYAVNCSVKGVELENCNYAHITLQSSANITISGNYLHDAFDYGSGGKGYGVVLQFGASNNFIYDNIARHLRHSFLLQAEANGNVVAYNYSFEPYWKEGIFPAGSAGDLVLHGNYPYANLFEGNIIQNLVIDNSHGINGQNNTFFRNRIENYGIVINADAGNDMNFIANEITGSGLLKGLYIIEGKHTEIANNIKGSIQSGIVSEASLINKNYVSKIGPPNLMNSWNNEAYIRSKNTVKTFCAITESEKTKDNITQTKTDIIKKSEIKKKKTRKKKSSK